MYRNNAAREAALDLVYALQYSKQARADARAYENPDLTPEALAAERDKRLRSAGDDFTVKIQDYEDRLRQILEAASEAVEKQRPTATADELALAWHRTEQRLDAGMELQDVLRRATPHEALAIREFMPVRLEVAAYRKYATQQSSQVARGLFVPPDTRGLMAAVDDRLAEVIGGDFAAAVDNAGAAATYAALALPYAEAEKAMSRAASQGIARTEPDGQEVGLVRAEHFLSQPPEAA